MNKVDPGPAFQWETVVSGARKLIERAPPAVSEKAAERSMRGRNDSKMP
jgi:N-acetyl-anhydromuramyl-L-alanine amidase AmpD